MFEIAKADEKGRVFGWANVAMTADGQPIEDLQQDLIDPADLEEGAYRFLVEYREAGENHQRIGVATVIESCVMTMEKQQAMGIPPGVVPIGWWLGLQITDPAVRQAVKERRLTAFSIGGTARREEVK